MINVFKWFALVFMGVTLMTAGLLLSVKMNNDPVFMFIAGAVAGPIVLAIFEMFHERR